MNIVDIYGKEAWNKINKIPEGIIKHVTPILRSGWRIIQPRTLIEKIRWNLKMMFFKPAMFFDFLKRFVRNLNPINKRNMKIIEKDLEKFVFG